MRSKRIGSMIVVQLEYYVRDTAPVVTEWAYYIHDHKYRIQLVKSIHDPITFVLGTHIF